MMFHPLRDETRRQDDMEPPASTGARRAAALPHLPIMKASGAKPD
jgi:hypothetical protein